MKPAYIFAIVAILVGLGVSYFPPIKNAEEIWGLVSVFLGYGMRELFRDVVQAKPENPTQPAKE